MKIQKAELTQKLNKIKGVIPRKATIPALQGVLVMEGYLIANNTEMTIKAKIDGAEGEFFIIPERAIDLINNLPEGEIDISASAKNTITIKLDKIKNKYKTLDPEQFPVAVMQETGTEFAIKADVLLESMKRVSYAVPAQGSSVVMSSMCLHAGGGRLDFVGLDGHVLAWDNIAYEGEFELLIPKNTVDRLKSLGLSGKVMIKHSKAGAVFITEEYEIYTRLIEGAYFRYQTMFKELPLHVFASRMELLDALIRAKMCAEELSPVRFKLQGNKLDLEIKDNMTEYHETVDLQEEIKEPLTIGFNARLVIETLKAFDSSNIDIYFENSKMPMIIENRDNDFKAIVLPVAIV